MARSTLFTSRSFPYLRTAKRVVEEEEEWNSGTEYARRCRTSFPPLGQGEGKKSDSGTEYARRDWRRRPGSTTRRFWFRVLVVGRKPESEPGNISGAAERRARRLETGLTAAVVFWRGNRGRERKRIGKRNAGIKRLGLGLVQGAQHVECRLADGWWPLGPARSIGDRTSGDRGLPDRHSRAGAGTVGGAEKLSRLAASWDCHCREGVAADRTPRGCSSRNPM
jgi:hypothetical protein